VQGSVDRISSEEAAKEHHFRGQEDPHPKCRRVALLLSAVELMGYLGKMWSNTVSQICLL
jgi:hypothetical protein